MSVLEWLESLEQQGSGLGEMVDVFDMCRGVEGD